MITYLLLQLDRWDRRMMTGTVMSVLGEDCISLNVNLASAKKVAQEQAELVDDNVQLEWHQHDDYDSGVAHIATVDGGPDIGAVAFLIRELKVPMPKGKRR